MNPFSRSSSSGGIIGITLRFFFLCLIGVLGFEASPGFPEPAFNRTGNLAVWNFVSLSLLCIMPANTSHDHPATHSFLSIISLVAVSSSPCTKAFAISLLLIHKGN